MGCPRSPPMKGEPPPSSTLSVGQARKMVEQLKIEASLCRVKVRGGEKGIWEGKMGILRVKQGFRGVWGELKKVGGGKNGIWGVKGGIRAGFGISGLNLRFQGWIWGFQVSFGGFRVCFGGSRCGFGAP